MIKKIIKGILIASVATFYFYFLFIYDMSKNEKWLNDEICNFAKKEIKGRVQEKNGHGRYNRIRINDTLYYYQISKVIINSFKEKSYYIDVGDSIVKKANSKRITVYRGDKKSIFLLNCED